MDNRRAMATLLLNQLSDGISNVVLIVAAQYLTDEQLNEILEFALFSREPGIIKNMRKNKEYPIGIDILDKVDPDEVEERIDRFLNEILGISEEDEEED